MEVKKALENYNNYSVRIAVIDRKLFKLRQEEATLQSTKLDGMPKAQGFTVSNIENEIIYKLTQIEELETETQQLLLETSIVDKLILALKKNTQDIVNMRYKEKFAIEYIADKKGRTYRAVSSILGKAVKEMQEEYDRSL